MVNNPFQEIAVSLLHSLVAFDTTSQNSNLDCIDYIEYYLHTLGVHATRLNNADKSKASLIATIGPRKAGGIVFSGHTDVVPVQGQPWRTSPFELTESDDKLRVHGRGTCDMKGFIACTLAMIPFIKSHSKAPVHLAFSYDEEIGCLAAPAIADFLSNQTWRPDLVVIGEPTNMNVIDAHKGAYSYITRITGLEGHSSKPHLGVNAVMAGGEIIHTLNQLAAEYRQPNRCNERFDPPYTSIHVGKMAGGSARNIIPNECEIVWEVRALPGQDVAPILDRVNNRSEELLHHMRMVHPEANIITTQQSFVPGLSPDLDNHHSHCVMHAAGSNASSAVAFATEAGIFQNHGFTTLVCGPGSIEQAHKANEFVTYEQLSGCLNFIDHLIHEFPYNH
ncbi:MAG: acetylornithine deacetylase [Alphaproteobacteria bacterium]|nr:acetylornithine deacetylase [Alphaproteobacteria bacterium]